jgi:hypothetical protein
MVEYADGWGTGGTGCVVRRCRLRPVLTRGPTCDDDDELRSRISGDRDNGSCVEVGSVSVFVSEEDDAVLCDLAGVTFQVA